MGLYGGNHYVRITDFMGTGERRPAHDRPVMVDGDAMGGVETGLSAPAWSALVHACASLARLLAPHVFLVVVSLRCLCPGYF